MTYRKDYYEILQVGPRDSLEEIHAAYRRLSRRYHPDVGGDEENMKLLNEAYNVLRKYDSRHQYEMWLESCNVQVYQLVSPWISFWSRWTEITLNVLMAGWALGFRDIKTEDVL
jgi:preprotein translocase subunit Sec63